jgi:hypothetical protein
MDSTLTDAEIEQLLAALKRAIERADAWYEDSTGWPVEPNLDAERALLKRLSNG